MNNLTFTQEFALCVLNREGTINFLKKTETSTCLVASSLWDLLFDKIIALDDKGKIEIKTELPPEKEYLRPLYNTIKESRSKKPKAFVEDYVVGMTSKKLNSLIESLISSLVKKECLTVEVKRGLISEKTLYVPKEDCVRRIVEKIRAEFLEDGTLSDETAVLGVLLKASNLLKTFFSKPETEKVNERIEELKNTSASPFIKEIIDEVESAIMVIITANVIYSK
jgi:hypothetical protein